MKLKTAEAFVDAVKNPTCSRLVDGKPCGKPATCVIKTRQGSLLQEPNPADKFEDDRPFGRGTGSVWEPICEEHKACYSDHEGFELDGSTQFS